MAHAGPVGLSGPRPEPASPAAPPRWLEALVAALDDAIRIPGTNARVGADAIIGLLLPGAGDAIGLVASLSVLWLAFQAGVPRTTLARMVVNVGIDAVLGAVPVAGDLFDVAYKANRKNLRLLEAHRSAKQRALALGDIAFFSLVALVVIALAAAPILLVVWIVK